MRKLLLGSGLILALFVTAPAQHLGTLQGHMGAGITIPIGDYAHNAPNQLRIEADLLRNFSQRFSLGPAVAHQYSAARTRPPGYYGSTSSLEFGLLTGIRGGSRRSLDSSRVRAVLNFGAGVFLLSESIYTPRQNSATNFYLSTGVGLEWKSLYMRTRFMFANGRYSDVMTLNITIGLRLCWKARESRDEFR